MREPHPTDLTDAQGELVAPHVPPARGRRRVEMRQVVNAISYITRAGCQWRMRPKDFPEWRTVHDYHTLWAFNGTWRQLTDALRRRVRREHHPGAGEVLDAALSAVPVCQAARLAKLGLKAYHGLQAVNGAIDGGQAFGNGDIVGGQCGPARPAEATPHPGTRRPAGGRPGAARRIVPAPAGARVGRPPRSDHAARGPAPLRLPRLPDHSAGHRTPGYVLRLSADGVMPLFTPSGGTRRGASGGFWTAARWTAGTPARGGRVRGGVEATPSGFWPRAGQVTH